MWWWFNRKSPSGFSASSTAEEVTQGIDGTGLTAIVTGASGGIGSETCRVLAMRGVHVVMADINMAAGGEVKEAIVNEFPSAKVDAVYLDLSSLESVRKFATDYISTGRPLNLLINVAGIMGTPFKLSKDNIELQFATNYLGHFLMTNLLLETMKKTSVESKREGRIVNVSSEAHRWSNWSYPEGIRFNNINDPSGYDKFKAYGQSKLAKILHANELARRLKEEGVDITANSLHPGSVLTNIARHLRVTKGIVEMVVTKLVSLVLKDVHQGAATICYVALNPQVKEVSGEYFSDSNIDKASDMGKDPELAKKLWDFSMDLVK